MAPQYNVISTQHQSNMHTYSEPKGELYIMFHQNHQVMKTESRHHVQCNTQHRGVGLVRCLCIEMVGRRILINAMYCQRKPIKYLK